MSLIATLSTRAATSLAMLARYVLARFGAAPLILAAAALTAALLSIRGGGEDDHAGGPRRRRRGLPGPEPGPDARRGGATGTATGSAGGAASSSNAGASSSSASSGTRKPGWLSRVRRVTVGASVSPGAPGLLFCEKAGDATALQMRGEAADGLRMLARLFEVFLVVRVCDDATEQAALRALDEAGAFAPGLVDRRKVVFCETDGGRASVARQLEAHMHVDESASVVASLQRFTYLVALVAPDAKAAAVEAAGRNVVRFTSLPALLKS